MDKYDNPLFVDLDGTFTKTDLLFESLIIAIKNNPLVIFMCLIWIFKGKQHLKHQLSLSTDVDIRSLPLNQEFYHFLKTEKHRGRHIVLATGSAERYAREIASSYAVFDGFISSNNDVNLTGKRKLEKIQETNVVFSYAGNEKVDFHIFRSAKEKILVNPSPGTKKRAKHLFIDKIFDDTDSHFKSWFAQLRIYQWLKNFLIFVPLLVSGNFTNTHEIFIVSVAFFAFGCLASSTYIVNDLIDLESDRQHPDKKFRPLASGLLSIKDAIAVSVLLFIVSLLLSLWIGHAFVIVVASYLFLTIFYSFQLKKFVAMDVIALALLYTLRILAGASAIDETPSFWLLAFSIFVFLSLALVKRCSEIKAMMKNGKTHTKGRDYTVDDYTVLCSFGVSSALLAVLMFCFYINNNALSNQYQQPNLLWLIVPALTYWLMRMWIKTHRGEMHHDPIIFSLKDYGSIVTIVISGVVAIVAQVS